MSPRKERIAHEDLCFPRVSGDEPERVDDGTDSPAFSPRERG